MNSLREDSHFNFVRWAWRPAFDLADGSSSADFVDRVLIKESYWTLSSVSAEPKAWILSAREAMSFLQALESGVGVEPFPHHGLEGLAASVGKFIFLELLWGLGFFEIMFSHQGLPDGLFGFFAGSVGV